MYIWECVYDWKECKIGVKSIFHDDHHRQIRICTFIEVMGKNHQALKLKTFKTENIFERKSRKYAIQIKYEQYYVAPMDHKPSF